MALDKAVASSAKHFYLLNPVPFAIGGISSYFVGLERYQSNWEKDGTTTTERASWLVSNFGSIGFAWRFQMGDLGEPTIPDDASQVKTFRGSATALDHIHPEGLGSWHWIQFHPMKLQSMGSMETGYEHLFVPYWIVLVASGILVVGPDKKGALKRRQ